MSSEIRRREVKLRASLNTNLSQQHQQAWLGSACVCVRCARGSEWVTKTQAQMEHEVSAFTRVLECVCGLRIDSTCLIWGQLAELGSGLPESRDKNASGHIQCVCVCARMHLCVLYTIKPP